MNKPTYCNLAESIKAILDSDEDRVGDLCDQLDEVTAPYDQVVMCSSVEAKFNNERVPDIRQHPVARSMPS